MSILESIETCNAVIESASLTCGENSRGMLSAWIQVNYGGVGQGFGGYSLYLPKSFKHHTLESPAGHFIFRVMQIAGVYEWGALIGRTIRVRRTWTKIHAIGHIVKDDWFDPEVDFEPLKKENSA